MNIKMEKLPNGILYKRNWKQILEFIKGIKGMHSKDEKRLRIFIEAVWREVVANGDFCQKSMAITEVYTNDLRDGAKGVFGKIYWSTQNKSQT